MHMKSIREVTARGSGHWYHAFDVELATGIRTWADSGGTRTRTVVTYELRINDARVPGGRVFSTEEERQAFIGRSFSDLTLRDLDPPLRENVAHPLAHLVGQPLDAVVFEDDYFQLLWSDDGLDGLNVCARACVKNATGCTGHGAAGYPDRLSGLAGLELAGVDELLDRGLVLTFTGGTELVIPLSGDPALRAAAEYYGAIWYAGEPPFE
jgi:hypothetical protein